MNKQTILSLQAIRFFAAGIVVIYHAQTILLSRGYIDEVSLLFKFGQSGVDIFFVLSGFIMVFIGWDYFNKPGASVNFLIKRAIRIIPIYWFYSFAIMVIILLFPHLLSQGEGNIAHILASFLFIPWENNIGVIHPILPVGWTLSFEVYFYITFSIMLLFNRAIFLPMIACWFVAGVAIGLIWDKYQPIWLLMTSPLLVEFLMGCFIGFIYKRNTEVSSKAAAWIFGLGLSVFLCMIFFDKLGLPRTISWGIPAAIMIFGMVYLEKHNAIRVPGFLVMLGNSSYSLYLSHLFSVHLVLLIWMRAFGDSFYMFTFVALLISLVVAHFSYILIEKPSMVYLNNVYREYNKNKI